MAAAAGRGAAGAWDYAAVPHGDVPLLFFDETEHEEQAVGLGGGDVRVLGSVNYGQRGIWPATFALANLLAGHGADIVGRDARVVELGAGAGLPGVVAARWAKHVCLTDGDGAELPLLRENASRYCDGRAEAFQLRWNHAEEDLARADQRPHAFDVVLAAEVCYVPSAIPHLVQTMDRCLKPTSSFALLANSAVSTVATQAECRSLLDGALNAAGFRCADVTRDAFAHGAADWHAHAYFLVIWRDPTGSHAAPPPARVAGLLLP